MHRSRTALAAIAVAGSLLLGVAGGTLGQSPEPSPDPSADASPEASPAWETLPTDPAVPIPSWGLEDIPEFLADVSPFTAYLVMQCATNAEQGPEGESWQVPYYSDLDYCLEAISLLDPEGGLDWAAGGESEAEVEIRDLPLEKWNKSLSWRWLETDELTCRSGVSGCLGILVKARKACPKGVTVKLTAYDKNEREVDIMRGSLRKLPKGKQETIVFSTMKPSAETARVEKMVCRQ